VKRRRGRGDRSQSRRRGLQTKRTIRRLDKEPLDILPTWQKVARRVRHSGTDRKWTRARDLLTDNTMITGEKIIISRAPGHHGNLTGDSVIFRRPDAVCTIHGGVRREERRRSGDVRPGRRHPVLVAT